MNNIIILNYFLAESMYLREIGWDSRFINGLNSNILYLFELTLFFSKANT